ncbi:MAG: hypothetical protein JNM17_17870 [Archangium sp.]|nr:hypothetical protein [Archangium sp.]
MRPLTPSEEKSVKDHFRHFDRVAHVIADGKLFAFNDEQLTEVAMAGRFFGFSEGDYNSSVVATIVGIGRRFHPSLNRSQIIALCAATLKITVERVEHSLEFTANYMAMHDGTEVRDNHPYPPDDP